MIITSDDLVAKREMRRQRLLQSAVYALSDGHEAEARALARKARLAAVPLYFDISAAEADWAIRNPRLARRFFAVLGQTSAKSGRARLPLEARSKMSPIHPRTWGALRKRGLAKFASGSWKLVSPADGGGGRLDRNIVAAMADGRLPIRTGIIYGLRRIGLDGPTALARTGTDPSWAGLLLAEAGSSEWLHGEVAGSVPPTADHLSKAGRRQMAARGGRAGAGSAQTGKRASLSPVASDSAMRYWEALGISRRTWYRRGKPTPDGTSTGCLGTSTKGGPKAPVGTSTNPVRAYFLHPEGTPMRHPGRLIDRAETVSEGAVLLRRAAGRRNEHGEWEAGAIAETAIKVWSAPMGRDRNVTTGGAEPEAGRVFYSGSEIRIGMDDRDGDIIRWQSELWRVTSVAIWQSIRGTEYEATTERSLPQDTEPPIIGATSLERAIRAHVREATGIAVIPANDHGPRPVGAHATVLLQEQQQAGDAIEIFREDDDVGVRADVRVWRRSVASIQFFRADARPFLDWLDTPNAKEAEHRRGFAAIPPFVVRDLAAVVASEWEARSILDLTIEYAQDVHQPVDTIERVEFEAKAGGLVTTGAADANDS